jgi:Flp pilus assembly pilin Flp
VSVELENLSNRLWRDQRGATLIECALLIGLITLIVLGSIVVVGQWVNGVGPILPFDIPWRGRGFFASALVGTCSARHRQA